MRNSSLLRIYGKLIISASCWGGAFVAAKIVVQQLPPTLAAALRFTLAFSVLLVALIIKEGKKAWVPPRDWALLIAAALTGIALYNIFFFTGMIYTSPINGSLIVSSGPVMTTLISGLLFKERITGRQSLGLFLSLDGVAVIISQGSWSILKELAFNKGDLIIAGALFCWSLYTVIGKATGQRWSSLLATTYACGLGAVILWIFAWPHVHTTQWQNLEPPVIVAVIFMAVFASAIAFVFWYDGVRQVGAGRTSAFQNLVPVFSAVSANQILGDRIFPFHAIGAVLILYGVYLANSKQKPQPVQTLACSPKNAP